MSRGPLQQLKDLQKENQGLRRAFPGLMLNTLILNEASNGKSLGHVDKSRSHRRMDVMSMKPRKLSAVLS